MPSNPEVPSPQPPEVEPPRPPPEVEPPHPGSAPARRPPALPHADRRRSPVPAARADHSCSPELRGEEVDPAIRCELVDDETTLENPVPRALRGGGGGRPSPSPRSCSSTVNG